MPFAAKPRSVKDKRARDRARAKRAALRALKRAKRAAAESGVALSDWEGEFLGSVEGRVETYGSAFRDREKGPRNASLSILQTVKLKEISAKARGKKRSGFTPRRKPVGH
jgi:hypothetical protein